ncbi:MAG: zinc metallopeptidase [Oscillospiraceae bacterium]|nr:zinc metallopeptidase [Oscillospiraceae bacterium]
MFFDPLYFILVLPAVLLAMLAQLRVSSSFKKYSEVRTQNGVTGAEAAQEVLRRAGVDNVRIEKAQGHLTDHYDPRDNVIRLSESVYDAQTVAAVGVAAHEAGHAIQYAHGYGPIRFRMAILPMTNIGSTLALPLVILGFVLEMAGLIYIGILLFGAVVVFQLVTLPVEFNASRRAIVALRESGLLTEDEMPGSKKVLSAAALTYVGALAVSLAQLLRLVLLSRRRR